MTKVVILLGSKSDLPVTEKGVALFKEMGISYSLRIASAHRTPDHVHSIITDFEQSGGQVVICVAGMSAHLAGVVASLTTLPVLAVPVANQATAGLDALLSMGQMPPGIPVSTMSFGSPGFQNAALTVAQILALSDEQIGAKVRDHRRSMAEAVLGTDRENRQDFTV